MSMISKYAYGDPFHTEAAAEEMEVREGLPEFGEMEIKEGFTFSYRMAAEDIVYGLGEANRGNADKETIVISVIVRMNRIIRKRRDLCMPLITLLSFPAGRTSGCSSIILQSLSSISDIQRKNF